MQQLPPGLDPVRAGRWGLWLLGQRSHRRSLLRTVSSRRVSTGAPGDRFLSLFAPWSIHEYPGRWQIMAELLGISRHSARRYCYSKRLPAKHAATLERICRDRAAAFLALADELAGKSQGF